MRVLTPVGDLGPWDDVVAIMANRAHQVANVGLSWMGVRHDCLDNPLGGGELDHPLPIVGFVPVFYKTGAAPKVVWPRTQGNI